MTEEQKDILIAKMLDAPASLSDEELDMILLDDELKDIYEASAILSGAFAPQQEYDVAQEWKLFRHRIKPKPSLTRRFMRVAAIFLGVIVASGLIAKIIDHTITREYEQQMAEVAKPTTPKSQKDNGDTTKTPYVETTPIQKEFKKSATPAIATGPLKAVEAHQMEDEEEIDVDEYLRQQQEEIEDAIIQHDAEIYVDEYYAMREFISGMNDENITIIE